MTPEIEVTDADDPVAHDAVRDGLLAFNDPIARHGYRALRVLARNPGEAVPVGGLIGRTMFGWLYVDIFGLPEALRGTGLGAELLRRAEAEARARGCVGAHLDTFDFQARGFYERQGYAVWGTLEDQPPGHRRYALFKRLDD